MSEVGGAPPARDVLQELAAAAEHAIAQAPLSRPLRRSADVVLSDVRRSQGYGEALRVVAGTAEEVRRLAAALAELQRDLARHQQARSEQEPFGPDWRDSAAGEIARGGEEVAARWIARYAKAFVAGRFDVAEWLCGGAGADSAAAAGAGRAELRPPDRQLARRLLLAAREAAAGGLAATLPGLEILTESPPAAGLPPELRARAWCMRVRAVARGLGDAARGRDLALVALERAEAAGSAVPVAVLAALHAAHGECLLGTGDPAAATAAAERALLLAPREPAGSVLFGLVAEDAGDLGGADESYEDAADADASRASAGELFAPTPPNLLWHCGRRLRRTDPRTAARVLRQALKEGVRGTDDYPERKAYVDLARALELRASGATDEQLTQRLATEAAEAYWEAGRRYAWAGDETSAVDFLSRACELDAARYQYFFELAEVLRVRSVHEDGTVDLVKLERAADRWRAAYALGVPGETMPWAYVTMALVEHERSGDLYRPRASWVAVALLERALLCDPGNVRVTAQLSQAHRLLGARRTAVDLVETASRRDGSDELVFDQRLLALVEVERTTEALALLEAHGLQPDQPWLVIRQVQLLLTLDRPVEALGLLQTVSPLDQALNELYVGVCHELLGDEAAAREAYGRVAAGAGSAGPEGRVDLSAWACYLLGRYDEAEQAYAELVRHDPDDPSLRCALGQVLLARGDVERGDPEAGRDHLAAGIAATHSLWALTSLERVDLPRLTHRVGGGSASRPAVEEVVAVLRDREEVLRRAPDPRTELESLLAEPAAAAGSDARLGVLLALARLELTGRAVDAALERYVQLATEVPEGRIGLLAAATQLRRAADELADRDDPAGALAVHRRLLDLLDRAPEPLVELASAAHLRAAVAALDLGQAAAFEEHVRLAFPADTEVESMPAVREALAATGTEPGRYWALTDAARRVDAPAARRLLAALDPSALLRAGRDEPGSASLFLLATPLTLRLGGGLLSAVPGRGPTPRRLVELARRRVKADTGVPVPGIALQPLPGSADPGSYVVELYEVEIARGVVPLGARVVTAVEGAGARSATADSRTDAEASVVDPLTGAAGEWVAADGPDPAGGGWCGTAEEFVVRHLEAVIRTHLSRLFSIDDVGIWLAGLPGGTEAGIAVERLSLADRLELLRLLRLLLREQVPIVNVAAIVREVQQAGPDWTAPDLLPTVRARLRSRLVPDAVRAIPPVPLPAELEDAFAAGWSAADPDRWQLPRAEAAELAERVAGWHAEEAPAGAVVVRDPRLRPYFWRLLAGLVPGPVWVLAEEETDDS